MRPELTKIQDGVYDIRRGSDDIRLIVLNEIPRAEHNAIWHLFSGIPGEVEFAARQYRGKTQEISTVLNDLFDNYNLEGFPVSYTMQDFQGDYVRNHLGLLSPDEVLDKFSPDEVLGRFSLDEILKRFSPEEIQLYLKKLGKNTEK